MKLQNNMFRIVMSSSDDEWITYQIELNAEHFIYKAHFPSNPITPGVCIIKIITEILEQRLNRKLLLTKISNLKFISTISPVENKQVYIQMKIKQIDESCNAKGFIKNSETIVTKFSLVYKS